MSPIDAVRLNFDDSGLFVLNIVLALVMFGVALDLKLDDFRRVLVAPKGPTIGLLTQFLLLPALTYVLVRLLTPAPSIALGMLLVAACPGGNVSNFLAHLSKGRTVLSVSMTAVSTAACIVMTPLNVSFWGGLNPDTAPLLRDIALDPLSMLATIGLILGLPLVLGMGLAAKKPALAARLRKPFKILSILSFVGFVAVAFAKNLDHFFSYISWVFLPVLIMNALALSLGYGAARLWRLSEAEARAVSIEVGIQNSGLGLILVFGFFEGLGGMAMVTAWWGIWHIVSGLGLATIWARFPPKEEADAAQA